MASLALPVLKPSHAIDLLPSWYKNLNFGENFQIWLEIPLNEISENSKILLKNPLWRIRYFCKVFSQNPDPHKEKIFRGGNSPTCREY